MAEHQSPSTFDAEDSQPIVKPLARATLVVVDDETEILSAIRRVLMRIDVNVEVFSSPRQALQYIEEHQPVMVISDLQMPDINGMTLLEKVATVANNTRRILMSAFQDFDQVAKGFNDGVIEQFIAKPWNNRELQLLVEGAIGHNAGNQPQESIWQQQGIVTEHAAMLALLQQVEMAAGANVPIFIHGETGSGKELIAHACHDNGCKRDGDFVAVNCANFSDTLIESQLFGHKKGAFTGATHDQVGVFEQANNGTIFLDEITTLPLALQSKLLRVIQEREYTPLGSTQSQPFDAQIVSASAVSLQQAVAHGEFREDLFYRLNVIKLTIPPLRERQSDIVLLAKHFLKKFNADLNKIFKGFDAKAEQLLMCQPWQGNVRQLENVIHGVCIMNDGEKVTAEMIAPALEQLTLVTSSIQNEHVAQNTPHIFMTENSIQPASIMPNKGMASAVENGINVTEQTSIEPLHITERIAIENAIEQCDGNVNKAAALLEVNPSTLYRKIKSWQSSDG